MSKEKVKPIRVLRLIARMNVGGPALQVTTLLNSIPEDEVNQLLMTGRCQSGEVDYLEFANVEVKRTLSENLGRSVNPIGDLKAFFEIRHRISVFRPDIVHTHTFKAGLLGRFAALSTRPRPLLVHTFHGHLLNGYLKGFKLLALKAIERFLGKRTDYLVSVGEKVKEELIRERIGEGQKFAVIPPGFPMAKPNTVKNVNYVNDKESDFVCAWVGRMVEVKAPFRIIEIARATKKNKTPVKFIVAGDGPMRSEVQRQSEIESLPIDFLGWTSDIEQLLANVDLLIMTSLNEGTPISIIEAQRMGKPVLSTDVGSVREVISEGKSGYAIEYDPNRFAELIELFAKNKNLWKEFSEEALRFSDDKFDPERLARDYLRIYKSLVSK